MALTLPQLYQKYDHLYPDLLDATLTERGPYLHFSGSTDIGAIRTFAEDLSQTEQAKILCFWSTPPPNYEDLTVLLALCTEFIYLDDWSESLSLWAARWKEQGLSFPQVEHIKLNNLRTIFTKDSLVTFIKAFPNLKSLEYRTDFEQGQVPIISIQEIETACPGVLLDGFSAY